MMQIELSERTSCAHKKAAATDGKTWGKVFADAQKSKRATFFTFFTKTTRCSGV